MTLEERNTAQETSETVRALAYMLGSLTAALFLSLLWYVATSPVLYQFTRLPRTIDAVSTEYWEKWQDDRLFENAAAEVYGMLDRYSGYTSKERFDQIDEEFSGHYAGIGVSIIAREEGLLVATINEDGPARKAGALLGDLIIEADSVPMAGRGTLEASAVLRGSSGDTVHVTIKRPRAAEQTPVPAKRPAELDELAFDTLTLPIVRSEIPLQHITYAGITDDSALYFRIDDFESGLSEQFKRVFDSLREIRPNYRGVIVDLRNNPGGLLSEAFSMADFFLNEDILILGEKGRSRWSRREFFSTGEDQTGGATLVTLVNRGSASASEIFAGSLKYAQRATILGDTTFGKGLVQSYSPFPDGSASRLTIARYYFTGERYLNQPGATRVDSGAGIPPDEYSATERAGRFIRTLAAQFYFYDFASRHQDWVIRVFEGENSEDIIREFEHFATISGFSYKSELLQSAQNLYMSGRWTTDARIGARAELLANEIVERADKLEENMFQNNSVEIIQRLARIAYERRDGEAAAYRSVFLPTDHAIQRAQEILRLES